MTNNRTGSTPALPVYRQRVTIDGDAFIFEFGIACAVAIERESGLLLPEVLARIERGSISAMQLAFWGALQANHPSVTMPDASALMQAMFENGQQLPLPTKPQVH